MVLLIRQYHAAGKLVHWSVDPTLVDLGLVEIRWYGVFFAVGLLVAMRRLERVFEARAYPASDAKWLGLALPVGMIVGAHLVHLLFYEFDAFTEHPIRIVQVGRGLSSHGGGLGAFLALLLFCLWRRRPFFPYGDACLAASVWVFPFVRVGNFFNHEIVGRPSGVPWAVVFERLGDGVPRHPVQLYEALLGVALIALATWMERSRARRRDGSLFLTILACYFTGRFLLEFFKRRQAPVAEGWPVSMGQVLSAPIVLVCVALLLRRRGKPA